MALRPLHLVVAGASLATSLLAVTAATATRAAGAECSPRVSILESPRVGSTEVQAKALNDRGDVVGFADSNHGSSPIHAILWKRGKAAGAVDLGVLPGYVSSEAYGVNDDRVVYGLLYDKKERTFPFRWHDGRMTVLKGPDGRIQQTIGNPGAGGRNAINERGEIAWTLRVDGHMRAVRWTRDGKATFLPALPGHAWTHAWSINGDGTVSGWSRKRPSEDGENNPVIWTKSGKVVPLKTPRGRADGAAEATTSGGLIVGYLGTLGAGNEPESDQAAVWRTRAAEPRLLGPVRPNFITELLDVNDRGEAVGISGPLNPKTGFTRPKPVIWQTGWARLRPLPVPRASSRANPVVITSLNDINNRGAIVGTVYGLLAPEYGTLRRIDPVLWTCQFGR